MIFFDIPNGFLLDVENCLCAVYSFSSISEINDSVRFFLICRSKKHPVSSATTCKRRFAKTHTETKFPSSSFETRLSVDIRSTIKTHKKMKIKITGWETYRQTQFTNTEHWKLNKSNTNHNENRRWTLQWIQLHANTTTDQQEKEHN